LYRRIFWLGKVGSGDPDPGHGAEFKVLALGLDMLPPGQLPVEVKAEVLSFGFYRHWDSVQEYRRASNRTRGEGNM